MKNVISILLIVCLTPLISAAETDRPNIIVILADDMGYSDIGSYGGEIETPHLDRLADGGIKFSNFFNSARCCPTRAALMTGLNPPETGIGFMANPPDTQRLDHGPDFPNYRGFLNRNCMTIAEVLKENAYATLMTGKWHLGLTKEEQWPLQRGFEKFYGCLAGATNFFYPEYPRGITLGNEHMEKPESTTDRRFYTTDAFTDYSIQFIEEEKAESDRPYFLYLAYTAPHYPLHAHQEEVQKYIGKYRKGWDIIREERLRRQKELGLFDASVELSDRSHIAWEELSEEKKKEMDLRMAYYAAMVDRMDQNIGKLVNHLETTDDLDNTLIVFLSDNGACHTGGKLGGSIDPFDVDTWERTYSAQLTYGEVWANASNTPFRNFKRSAHEGGIATPFIAHWPNGIKPSSKWYRDSAYMVDIAPTIYEMAGAKYPKTFEGNTIPRLKGVSLTPAFKGEELVRNEPLFFEHNDNAALITNKWKLVGTKVSISGGPDESKWELYDHRADRVEANDLSSSHPEVLKELSQQWLKIANRVGVYPKPKTRDVSEQK